MKTAIAIVTTGLLLLGGLTWAQTQSGKHSGMMQQHAVANGSKEGATQGHPMQGMDCMVAHF